MESACWPVSALDRTPLRASHFQPVEHWCLAGAVRKPRPSGLPAGELQCSMLWLDPEMQEERIDGNRNRDFETEARAAGLMAGQSRKAGPESLLSAEARPPYMKLWDAYRTLPL